MTSRDSYNVILVTSQYSKLSHSETRIWKKYPLWNFKHALKQKAERRVKTWTHVDEEGAFRATALGTFYMTKAHRSESKASID